MAAIPRLSTAQQARLWEGLIAAEVRGHYFAQLAMRYHRLQRSLTWVMLLSSSGAVVSLIAKLPAEYLWVAPILALATTGLSFISLVGQGDKKATDAIDLHFRWNKLASEYENLWENMYAPNAQEQLARLDERAIDLGRIGVLFPNKPELLLKWQDHVERNRGVARAGT